MPVIALERFYVATHGCAASFSITAFFILTTRQNYTKPLTVSERKLKTFLITFLIILIIFWSFLIILPTSRVMAKQRLLHENEILQYFQR